MRFGIIDWAIVIAYLVFAGAVGIICRRYIHSMADFLVAGRGLKKYLGVATLGSTEMGLFTVASYAAFAYDKGFAALLVGAISGLTMMFLGATGFIIKRFRATRAMTVPEYFEQRFGRGVRVVGGVALFLAGVLNMGLFPVMAGKFIRHFTGMPEYFTFLGLTLPAVETVMSILLGIVLLYTLLGGMVSVVLTDFVQFLILAVGMLIGTLYVFRDCSWEKMSEAVATLRGSEGFSPLAAFGVVWIVWSVLDHLGGHATWQPTALRTSSAIDEKTTKPMFLLTGLTFFGRAAIPMIWGLAALATLGVAGFVGDSEVVTPMYLSTIIPSGIAGLMLAGMLAAFMSTHE